MPWCTVWRPHCPLAKQCGGGDRQLKPPTLDWESCARIVKMHLMWSPKHYLREEAAQALVDTTEFKTWDEWFDGDEEDEGGGEPEPKRWKKGHGKGGSKGIEGVGKEELVKEITSSVMAAIGGGSSNNSSVAVGGAAVEGPAGCTWRAARAARQAAIMAEPAATAFVNEAVQLERSYNNMMTGEQAPNQL